MTHNQGSSSSNPRSGVEGRVRPDSAQPAQHPVSQTTTPPPSTTQAPSTTPPAGQLSVLSLSFNDSLVLSYLQGLGPNFNLAEALQKMQETMGFPNPSAMTPYRVGEDDAASLPAAGGIEEDAHSGDTVVLEDEERERADTRLYAVDQELDQPMDVAGPEVVAGPEPKAGPVAEEVRGIEPLDDITL